MSCRPFPWSAEVFGQGPGEAELGMGAMTSQVQRSAAAGLRSFGAVQSRVCLIIRKVCSRSNRRRNDCQSLSTSGAVASRRDHHSQTGLWSRMPGRWSIWRWITVPAMTGSSPSGWSAHAERRTSSGCS